MKTSLLVRIINPDGTTYEEVYTDWVVARCQDSDAAMSRGVRWFSPCQFYGDNESGSALFTQEARVA